MAIVKDTWYHGDCESGKWTDAGGLYQEVPQPCINCTELTHRLDVTFEMIICSDCEEKVTLGYIYELGNG